MTTIPDDVAQCVMGAVSESQHHRSTDKSRRPMDEVIPRQLAYPRGVAVRGDSLSHRFQGPSGEVVVLREVTFSIPRDGYSALVGASGAGKTTLLSLIGGLERVQTGILSVGDEDVGSLEGDALAAYRRTTVGFIFQNFGLLDALTALENVELASMLAGERSTTRKERAVRVARRCRNDASGRTSACGAFGR